MKTYIQAEYGDLALTAMLSDHSNKDVVKKHYLAHLDAVRKSADFRVFPEDKPTKSK